MPDASQQTKEDRIAAERARILADYRATFGSEPGKRVLAHLRAAAGILQPAATFGPGGILDASTTVWRDGRKSIVLEIEAHLATPEDRPEKRPQAKGRKRGPA